MENLSFNSTSVQLQTLLAEASTSSVYKATAAGLSFAVKKVPLANDALKDAYRREAHVYAVIGRHPRVVSMLDHTQLDNTGYLLLELSTQGNLKTQILAGDLTESTVLQYGMDLAEALVHLHAAGVVHRDLRPENALLFEAKVKLVDFGSASLFSEQESMNPSQLESDIHRNVPPHYRSPEQLRSLKHTSKADAWQLGCFLYSLLFRENAFSIKGPAKQLLGDYQPFRRQVAEPWQHVFKMLLQPEQSRRASASDFLQFAMSAEVPDTLTLTADQMPSKKFAVQVDLLPQNEVVWVRMATLNTEGPPDPHYTQKLLMLLWKDPRRASEFFAAVGVRRVEKTVVALKVLMLAHRVLYSGPDSVFYTEPSAVVPLCNLLEQWTPEALAARPGDYMRCEYFAGLIRQMARELIEKTKLHRLHRCRGNWMLEKVDQSQILPILEYWKRMTRICNGLFSGVEDLADTRAALTKQLLIEQYRLIHVLSNSVGKESIQSFVLAFEATRESVNRLRSLISDLSLPDLDPNLALRLIQAVSPSPQGMIAQGNPHLEEPKVNFLTSEAKQKIKKSYSPSPAERRPRDPSPSRGPQLDFGAPYGGVAPLMAAPEIIFAGSQPKVMEEEHAIDHRWLVTMEELKCGELLGTGSSCSVYKGFYRRTRVAIKMLRNTQASKFTKEFYREIAAMSSLRHPNLVLFMGACVSPSMAIVTEFCAGDTLFKLLHERKEIMLSWRQKLQMAKDVAMGMCYLHECKPPILHRDLKSLNLLLKDPVTGATDPVCVKITDFGVARILEDNTHMTGQTGTPHWMAPEVISNRPYSLKADVYSYAVVLWEICARDIPYKHLHPMSITLKVVQSQERPNMSVIPSSCPAKMKLLITQCWQQEPSRRPNFEEILDVLESIDIS
jgi:serine/threonine protein kinase